MLRSHQVVALLLTVLLTGCANIVPQFDIPPDPYTGMPTVASIVDRVTCELAALIAPGADNEAELLTGQYEVAHSGRVDLGAAVRQPIAQSDERFNRVGRAAAARNDGRQYRRLSGPIDEVAQRFTLRSTVAVEAMFQCQLERAEGLHLANDEEVIIEECVNHGVARPVERRLDVGRRGAGEMDARDSGMVICQCDSAHHSKFNHMEVRETWIRLQDRFD